MVVSGDGLDLLLLLTTKPLFKKWLLIQSSLLLWMNRHFDLRVGTDTMQYTLNFFRLPYKGVFLGILIHVFLLSVQLMTLKDPTVFQAIHVLTY